MIQCNKCKADNRDEALYCRRCGEKLPDQGEDLLHQIIGQDEVVNEIRNRANFYLACKGNNDKQRPEMDMLLLGSSGTGKDFIAQIIQDYFFKKGIVNKQWTRVDAPDFNQWIENKTIDDFKQMGGGILFINNVDQLMTSDSGIMPIDTLLSRMEEWENDSQAGWNTYPIIIFAGLRGVVEEYFKEKPAGLNRFAHPILKLKDMNAVTLSEVCRQHLADKGFSLSPDADKRLLGYFRYVVRNMDAGFRNAFEAKYKGEEIRRLAMSSGHGRVVQASDIEGKVYEPKTFDQILEELDDFVGIEDVKHAMHKIVRSVEQQKREHPDSQPKVTNQFVFFGNPGTGKTTVARLFGEMLYELGVLPGGQFIEVTREDLVGRYIGETAPKTMQVVDNAMGGVLFIDEAYTLATGGDNDFGREAINALLKPVEERRGEFICIVAGYTKEMQDFLKANSGVDSRFDYKINFADYTPQQMTDIFLGMMKKEKYSLDAEATQRLPKFFETMYNKRTVNWGNAREVRNTFTSAVSRHKERLSDQPDDMILTTTDIEGDNAKQMLDLDSLMTELDRDFVGMEEVKNFIIDIGNKKNFIERRLRRGLNPDTRIGMNLVLMGNPGTGKTEIARRIGKILYAMNVLQTPEIIERQRKDIIGEYLNQADKNMNKIFDLALGGTLFIDEAYTLVARDYHGGVDTEGRKALEVLMQRMNDDKGKLCVIMAGYQKEMQDFINVNQGFERRIDKIISLPDYSVDQLQQIFMKVMAKSSDQLKLAPGAEDALKQKIVRMLSNRDANWGNAGEMPKLYKQVKDRMEARLLNVPDDELSNEDYVTLLPKDFDF